MNASPEARRLVRRSLEDAADEIVFPDLVAHAPGDGDQVHGVGSFKAWLRWYGAAFTDAEWSVHDVISAGDGVLARYSGRVTYGGGLLSIPPRNQRVVESGILIFRVENGKIREIWSEMGDLRVVVQLGAFPVPDE